MQNGIGGLRKRRLSKTYLGNKVLYKLKLER